MTRALHFVHHPSLIKAESLAAYIQQAGLHGKAVITAVLFVADGEHIARYGRGLYGETWHRCDPDPCQIVHGVLIDALAGRERRRDEPLSFDRDCVSQSDLERVCAAIAQFRSCAERAMAAADVEARIAAFQEAFPAIRESPLWEAGPSGMPLDLLKPARDRVAQNPQTLDAEDLSDHALILSHAAY